jgi:hypothetical protein
VQLDVCIYTVRNSQACAFTPFGSAKRGHSRFQSVSEMGIHTFKNASELVGAFTLSKNSDVGLRILSNVRR